MPSKTIKNYILDTNVILHDSSCIYQFEEHNIIVPIAVLEELDHFKKGNEIINYHAREFLRNLDAISGQKLFNEGLRIAKGMGKILVVLDNELHTDLENSFSMATMDHRILNTAYWYFKDNPSKQTILVTKDVNLRMKAKSVGLKAEDYSTDRVKDIETLYSGRRVVENVPEDLIDAMYKVPFEVPAEFFEDSTPFRANEYLMRYLERGGFSSLYPKQPERTFVIGKGSSGNIQ